MVTAADLLNRFRFVPDARLDDLMISYATDSGGVGPHFDSYDVFLLQALGTRRWRIGRQKKPELQEGVPLKILTNFCCDGRCFQPGSGALQGKAKSGFVLGWAGIFCGENPE